ncbi:hypothetical protein [Rhizobacter sp. SG703]|uniref:hypothetical protein n=1 Tax=Rhizobacter sp. SG703 TaxID=2587140 RepID=UPI001444B9B6|nr:hypothetical protein [Rhizobacter sp. SG703]NKI92380.1 hypothetical protein [Rhizobacter sp. SG703]
MPARRDHARPPRRSTAAPRVGVGLLVLAGLFAGCGPAHSNDGGNGMIFGLFKSKYTTSVGPQVGASLVREAAWPASMPAPPAASYPQVRNVSIDGGLPPAGTLAATRAEHPAAEAFVIDATAGQPALAVVNTYDPERRTQLWQLDARDARRFDKQRSATFDAAQAKWLMYSAESVLALPGRQLLIQLKYHKPQAADGLFVYDAEADRIRSFGNVEPDWSRGLPFRFIDSLQLLPDALLVRYQTDKERLGPQRYVNHFEHLVLFSPRHRDGLELAKLGLDDGSVRRWGLSGSKLWLQTVDERASPPREFVWSLDLARVL